MKRIIRRSILVLAVIAINIFLYFNVNPLNSIDCLFSGIIQMEKAREIQLFWSDSSEFTEEKSVFFAAQNGSKDIHVQYTIPAETSYLRIDFGTEADIAELKDLTIIIGDSAIDLAANTSVLKQLNQVNVQSVDHSVLNLKTENGDPFIVFDLAPLHLMDVCQSTIIARNHIYKLIACLSFDIFAIIAWLCRRKIAAYLGMFVNNATLIFNLSVNDFKTRFAGAAFGVVWAFVQPIVTILVYWFVFQVGFRNGNLADTGVPYALWLSTGLIPWFFFSEAWNSATNSLMEYNYLVKKVVFNVSVIPVVKIISALFVHVFFVCLLLIMYVVCGMTPSLYWIQVIYYSFAMFVLVLALTYISASLVLFFKDMTQIITVILQVGVWITPILWDLNSINSKWQWIFKLNPMLYIADGYRKSLIYHEWAWNHVVYNIYFWAVTLGLLIIGLRLFERLKPHFADVL